MTDQTKTLIKDVPQIHSLLTQEKNLFIPTFDMLDEMYALNLDMCCQTLQFIESSGSQEFSPFIALLGKIILSLDELKSNQSLASFAPMIQSISESVHQIVAEGNQIASQIEDQVLNRHFTLLTAAIDFQLVRFKIASIAYINILHSQTDDAFQNIHPSFIFPHAIAFLLQLITNLFHTLYPIFSVILD